MRHSYAKAILVETRRTTMVIIQRFVCVAFLIALWNFTPHCYAQANVPDAFADFLKCDSLLGKSPKEVLAELGPPTVTQELLQYGGHILEWQYNDAKRCRLKADFVYNKLLFADVVTFTDPLDVVTSTKPINDLITAFKKCKVSSLKMGYQEAFCREHSKDWCIQNRLCTRYYNQWNYSEWTFAFGSKWRGL